MHTRVIIHVTGSHSPGMAHEKRGTGGWAAVLKCGRFIKEIVGTEPNASNARLELLGCIAGLEALKRPLQVELRVANPNICRGVRENWPQRWRRKGYFSVGFSPIRHADLWEKMGELMLVHEVVAFEPEKRKDEIARCRQLAREARSQAA
jgi:ribonuclease HI